MDVTVTITILVQLLVLVVFANRYFTGTFLRLVMGKNFDEKRDDYEPTVSIVVPMFNEGNGIYQTVKSLLELDYPQEKLNIIVVDDCSTDDSHAWATKASRDFGNVTVLKNPQNMGKRRSINHAVRRAKSEIIVSVDSDVVVHPRAVRELVARFVKPEIAAVGGRVHVINRHENWLTKMQAIKYFFGYEYLKNTERAFQSVMCLSGCLTAYRREVLMELEPILENRNICGIAIKYGEDRFLTRQIIKAGWKTTLTLDAISYTKAPPTLSGYFAQQLRWRRSNLVDYFGGLSHAWALHPVVAVHYLSLFALMVVYPIFIFHALRSGRFFDMAALHVAVLSAFAFAYQYHAFKLPKEERVHPIYFLAMAIIMPVTYIVLTPVALFTLDSGSWETRGHSKLVAQGTTLDDAVIESDAVDASVLEVVSASPALAAAGAAGIATVTHISEAPRHVDDSEPAPVRIVARAAGRS
jgi:cellulose synthase/poly-beta-1,6-N-acetylglucosamine synthase-like glycosyltransferase